tara:strand:+ start:5674 stop:5955 length:282 start_codon:yes stop_codon:yes gene_type:complete
MKKKTNNADDIKKALSKEWAGELQKCKDSPFYFYNKYVVVEGGVKLTEEQWNQRVEQIESMRNASQRVHYPVSAYPLTEDQMFKSKEDETENS